MHIVHITDRASLRGGADVHLAGVVARQRLRGHRVTVAAGRDDGEPDTTTTPPKLVHGLAQTRKALPADTIATLDALCRDADVVHVHNAIHPAVLAWAADRGAVATVQDHRSFCPGQGKLTLASVPCTAGMAKATCAECFADRAYHDRIQDITEQRLAALTRMRAVTVLSQYMRAELLLVGLQPERVHVIAPFVRGMDREAEANGPPCVLFAGRLVAAKGATDAALAHRRSGVALPLVFAGTGTLRKELEQRYEVLGWQPHHAMSAIYRRARALIMPSRWQEPFGIAGIEALALGVPVVAYDSGGIREWHPGQGLLVPWGDVDALAAALRRAVTLRPAASHSPPQDSSADPLEQLYASISPSCAG